MAQGQLRSVVRYLRDLAGEPRLRPTDRYLLERFAVARDEEAFADLMRRHGPLVWGVCRRVLGSRHDAEDVFQATFFVLARKAAAIRWRDSVSSWLHQVAYRLSHEMRVKSARRRLHELAATRNAPKSPSPGRDQDVFALLDEELHRLPAKLRAPLLACYLQGKTSDQAAEELGWSLRTLQRRLAQGRELLRARLTRRGVTLSAALLLATLTQNSAEAALPAALAAATAQAAVPFATGVANTANETLLAQGFLKGTTMARWKLAAALAVLVVAATGGGLVARYGTATGAPAELDETASQKKGAPAADAKPAKSPVDEFAGKAWDILEIVSKQHLEPRPRAELIVAGITGLLESVKSEPPEDLAKRAAAIQTRDEFVTFLRPLWPSNDIVKREAVEEAFLKGVARRAGGELRVLPGQEMKIQEEISGNRYVGTGIQIKMNEQENRVQIVAAIRRGPARRAGVKNDDILLKVNDKDTKGAAVGTVVEWVRGEEGTPITFVVKQPGSTETRTYTMKRGIVPFESLIGWRRAQGDEWDFRPDSQSPIAYLYVTSLRTSTLQELRQLEPKLKADGFHALVLDFRFSSGDGQVRNAALFADGLLDGGLMWSSKGVDEQSRKEYRADRECLFRDWPIAVLIDDSLDRQHALVVAALQDNNRAVVVGEPTKNDGYVNTMVKLPDGKTGLIFRTGMLERAVKERGWPVKPDHEVTSDKKQRQAITEWHRKQEIAEEPTSDKAPNDPQLTRALELLGESLQQSPAKR
jgi:C-terminal peptidase prc